MDRNNGPEVRISKQGTTLIIMMSLEEIPPINTGISLQNQISHMGIIAQTMGDPLISAKINHLIETMEIDLEMDLLATLMGIGGIIKIFLVFHRPKGEIFHRITPIANQEVTNLTTPRSTDLIIDRRLVLHPMNKNFRGTITRYHLMWFASPQPMMLLTKYRIFVR